MTDTIIPTRRPLSYDEMTAILRAIAAADTPGNLTAATITSVLNTLLADDGRGLGQLTDGQMINPCGWAIPSCQWEAITAAAVNRAQQWGTGAQLSMELVDRMPGSYPESGAPVPDQPSQDWRPSVLEMHMTRDAADVITAATHHITALGAHFGTTSTQYADAAASWLKAISTLLSMGMGAHTVVRRDGTLSLAVRTGSGIHYGLIFHGVPRVCASDEGCAARITDNGTTTAAWPGGYVADHEHQPSYPPGAPQPGRWSFHS